MIVRYFIHCFGGGGASASLHLFSCPLLLATRSLLLTFSCFCVLFHSCCSHAQVFEKTLVHAFHTSDSHTEWYFLTLLSENSNKIWKQSAVKQNPKLKLLSTLFLTSILFYGVHHYVKIDLLNYVQFDCQTSRCCNVLSLYCCYCFSSRIYRL